MRFDDSLETVLSAEMSSPFGAQSTWRQLVDLIGRRRTAASPEAIARLQSIRFAVPSQVRAASARALAEADPPAALVGLFFDEDISIAAPVLRAARLEAEEWIAMLPGMSPAARSILRHRRDLPVAVVRALEAFGPDDFRLPDMIGTNSEASLILTESVVVDDETPIPTHDQQPVTDTAFVSVGSIARSLPVVAEALRHAENVEPEETIAADDEPGEGPFQIADLVARIDAYKRNREDHAPLPANEDQPGTADMPLAQARAFRFETDAHGVVRWVDGASRTALIGLSLDFASHPGDSRVDGVAAGAFRRRTGFSDARLLVEGRSDAAGEWRISAIPVFEPASGRFSGYRGTARRPRMDESAAPARGDRTPAAESLRHLVHELRTPTNAIAGFAEMIETQLLGPVPQGYRDQASTIRRQTADLLTAIEDIDMAARLESDALDLRPDNVPVGDLLRQVATDLAPLAALRGTTLTIDCDPHDIAIAGDERAVERLVGRLMATLVASGGSGETIGIAARLIADAHAILTFDRPKTLAAFGNEALMSIDAEVVAEVEGAPLLGTGFALRLARNLAIELGGTLSIDAQRLTLRLPAAVITHVEQASSS